ncbi:MAG: EamA family transporter [Candidatus Saccharimonadales bacterium]
MPWQLTMLLQNVFASVYALESRTLANKYHRAHFQILAVTFSVVYAVFLIYGLMNADRIDMAKGFTFLPIIIMVAAAFTIWTVLTFITFRFVDAAVGTLLTVLNLLAVVITSTIIINESLSGMQLGGAILLIISIVFIFTTKQSKRHHHNTALAIMLSVVASICFGLAITGEKHVLNNIGGPTYAIVGIGAQFLFLALPALLYRSEEFRHFRVPQFRNKVVVMGIVRAGAGLLFILSMIGANNASLVGMLSGFKIILTTLLAAILLKEVTFIKRKLLASCIACVGVGLMVW